MFGFRKFGFDELMVKARLISRLLRASRGVEIVALTGSLARGEGRARDIDLVVFNSIGTLVVHVNQDKPERGEYNIKDHYTVERLGTIFSPGLQSAIAETCDGAKLDLIFVGSEALKNCEYLRMLADVETSKDLYRRLLCELPLYQYISASHSFGTDLLRHNEGSACCFPDVTWETVKNERAAKKRFEREHAY